ncbi:hypothetical protein [Parapedomonas caeni]
MPAESPAFPPRCFASEADIARLATGLLDHGLTREDWTHEAHFAATAWLLRHRPDIDLTRELPGIIARFNVAVGGQNTDSAGYHETLTQFYIRAIRAYLAGRAADEALLASVNALVADTLAERGFPLRFWRRETLFSVAARRGWVEPDLAPLPW